MPVESEKIDEQILDLKVENNNITRNLPKKIETPKSKYQCIVCQLNKISLSELHRHQTYEHSTEELSLSILGKRGLVKIIHPTSQEKENSDKSIWSSFSKKPSQFYYLSSNILLAGENKKENTDTPIDCSLPLEKVKKDNRNLKKLKRTILFQSCSNKIKEFSEPLEFDMKENRNNNSEVPIDCTLSCIKKENILLDSSLNNRIKKESKQPKINMKNEKEFNVTVDSQPVIKMKRFDENNTNSKMENLSKKESETNFDSNFKEETNIISNEWIVTKNITLRDFKRGSEELCRELEEMRRIAELRKEKKRKRQS